MLLDRRTDTAPAVVGYGSGMIMAWKGVDADTNMYWSRFDGQVWSEQRAFGDRTTNTSPELA